MLQKRISCGSYLDICPDLEENPGLLNMDKSILVGPTITIEIVR